MKRALLTHAACIYLGLILGTRGIERALGIKP